MKSLVSSVSPMMKSPPSSCARSPAKDSDAPDGHGKIFYARARFLNALSSRPSLVVFDSLFILNVRSGGTDQHIAMNSRGDQGHLCQTCLEGQKLVCADVCLRHFCPEGSNSPLRGVMWILFLADHVVENVCIDTRRIHHACPLSTDAF